MLKFSIAKKREARLVVSLIAQELSLKFKKTSEKITPELSLVLGVEFIGCIELIADFILQRSSLHLKDGMDP